MNAIKRSERFVRPRFEIFHNPIFRSSDSCRERNLERERSSIGGIKGEWATRGDRLRNLLLAHERKEEKGGRKKVTMGRSNEETWDQFCA